TNAPTILSTGTQAQGDVVLGITVRDANTVLQGGTTITSTFKLATVGVTSGAISTSLGAAIIPAANNGATENVDTVTITTNVPHGFVVGQNVTISGVGVGGYNGTFTITAVTANTFQYTNPTAGLAASGGGVVVLANAGAGPVVGTATSVGNTATL